MKNAVIKARVSMEKKQSIITECALLKITESEYLRQKLGEHSKSELIEIRYFLKKISNNINQTAKALNIANLTARIEPRRYEMAFASTYNLQKLFHKVLNEFAEIKRVN
ncbi:MAG: hypothetical protein K2Y14_09570 [Burkholderiales bacterium]|nr:hypothetical protein [Burkholderiales bacterium]